MWVSVARGGIALVVLTFLMWVLRETLNMIIPHATAGKYANAASVTRIAGYFSALTLQNLTLIAALAIGIYLLGRAAVERQVG
ncbi:MAG: hypothetical protein ABEI98_04785 [Halorhabdus sp.]